MRRRPVASGGLSLAKCRSRQSTFLGRTGLHCWRLGRSAQFKVSQRRWSGIACSDIGCKFPTGKKIISVLADGIDDGLSSQAGVMCIASLQYANETPTWAQQQIRNLSVRRYDGVKVTRERAGEKHICRRSLAVGQISLVFSPHTYPVPIRRPPSQRTAYTCGARLDQTERLDIAGACHPSQGIPPAFRQRPRRQHPAVLRAAS